MTSSSKKNIVFLLLSILIIYICYLYIDRNVAFWLYEQNFSQYNILKTFTKIVDVLNGATFIFYIYFILRFYYKAINQIDKKILVIANSIVLTTFFKNHLKFIFGRYWPQTWTHDNPSLIKDNAYGFHFFQDGSWYQSFPSGHTAVAVAASTAIWLLFPKLRWISIIMAALVIVGLLGMNYHFVSDVIAGGTLGIFISYATAAVMEYRNIKQTL